MQKRRIGYFDIAKSIAILFIIIGHIGIIYAAPLPGGMPPRIVHLAFSFHLPVFFIASGYFFGRNQALDGAFIRKGLRNLIVPYSVTCLFIIFGAMLFAFVTDSSMKAELFRWAGASLYGEGSQTPLSLISVERIGGIWFLLALFWSQIIVVAASRTKHPWIWIASVFLLGWASSQSVWLPLSLQSGMCAALFLFIGTTMRSHQVIERLSKSALAIFIILAVWLIYIFSTLNNMSFALFVLPSGIFDLMGSLAAALCVLIGCRIVERRGFGATHVLEWIGQNTLVIFCVHILEDNVMAPVWSALIPHLGDIFPIGGWIALLVIRCALIAAISCALYFIPGLSRIYYPSKRTPHRSVALTP